MRGISNFYTWFWIIYFPVCIAFTNVVNFDWSDEEDYKRQIYDL